MSSRGEVTNLADAVGPDLVLLDVAVDPAGAGALLVGETFAVGPVLDLVACDGDAAVGEGADELGEGEPGAFAESELGDLVIGDGGLVVAVGLAAADERAVVVGVDPLLDDLHAARGARPVRVEVGGSVDDAVSAGGRGGDVLGDAAHGGFVGELGEPAQQLQIVDRVVTVRCM